MFGRGSLVVLAVALAVAGIALGVRAPQLMTMVRPGPAAPVAPTWTATNTAIEQMQKRIASTAEDPVAYAAYANLGSLYLQKARETGDPAFYASAEQALRKSLELDASNPLAAVTMGGLHLARHEFAT
ncbi:MAG TPA: hypothetical protein VFN74_21320, partial [Chloroflexota bacterium]|nr:hypothetical protein [Chloroflexota bacterium]